MSDADVVQCGPLNSWRKELSLRRYYFSRWVRQAYQSKQPSVVVGGCDRSGTTLLRAALDSHPEIAAGPESWLFVYRRYPAWLAEEFDMPLADVERLQAESSGLAEFADRFFSAYCRQHGKSIWCEKSPRNIMRLDYIWRHFPSARVIHIIRDGRDVACSLRHHPRRRRINGRYVPTNINRPIAECIDHWVRYVSAGLRHRGDERYMEVHYEELVHDYETALRRIIEHCRVEWSPLVLDRERIQRHRQDQEIVNPEVRQPLYGSAIGRWREDLNQAEQRAVMARAGKLLQRLGYLRERHADTPPVPKNAGGKLDASGIRT